MSILGENLRRLRRDREFTLASLSRETGIPVTTINGIEKGAKTSYKNILKLSEALEIEANDLMGVKKDGELKENPILFEENPIDEFKIVDGASFSYKEKELIFKLAEYYNKNYYNDRYNLNKLNDNAYRDLRSMLYITLKTLIKNYQK